MLVDDQPDRALWLDEKLRDSGFDVISVLSSANGLLFQIEQLQPDLILVDLQSPGRDMLESFSVMNHHNPKPVVMFSAEDATDFIQQAVAAGVTAYMSEELQPSRVKPIIDLALAQFSAYQSLRQQLDAAKSQLAKQDVVERAKALLMQHRQVNEQQAHNALQKLAMDNNQSLPAAAQAVIQILGGSH